MKRTLCSCLMALFVSTSIFAQDMPVNPFIRIDSTSWKLDPIKFTNGQKLYTADPSARVWDVDGTPTLFVYPSRDMEPAFGCDMMDNYHVFSTTDMVNWKDYGIIFNADSVRKAWGVDFPIKNGGREAKFMWAPDCMKGKDGKYYHYFPHPYGPTWEDTWRIGIAISDYPAGPFAIHDTTLLGLPEKGYIDPNIFQDYDGTYYFYYGGSQRCFGGKLKDNMLELDGGLEEFDRNTQLKFFHEGTWVFSRIVCNDTIYYLTYPGNDASLPNYVNGQDQLLYAISKKSEGGSPLGPWTYKGSYLSPTGCDTSHGSVVEFNGQWYAFYHNAALSEGITNLRSICVDKLFFEDNCSGNIIPVIQTGEDRTIGRHDIPGVVQAEDFKNGGEGVGYHQNNPNNNGGSSYRLSTAVDIASSSEGIFVTNNEAGEWLAYDVNVRYDNVYRLEARVASDNNNGKFRLEIDGVTVATVEIRSTGGMDKWKPVFIHGIALPEGHQTIKLYIDNGGFNINYCMFALDSLPPIGCTIAIQQGSNYVTVASGDYLRCNRSNRNPPSETEQFIVGDAGDGFVNFRNVSNSKFISENTGNMTAGSVSATGANNKFIWSYMNDTYTQFALKGSNNNRFVWVDNNNANRPLQTKSNNLGGWETFIVKIIVPCSPVGIADVTSTDSKVSIYPVPANESITVAVELNNSSDVDISISDLQGKTLKTVKKNVSSGLSETNINVSGFASGMYLVNVLSSEFNVVKKIIVE